MTKILWDQVGEKEYETGVDRGVLYTPTNGQYNSGVGWNGLTGVDEKPTGAAATPQYADNGKYLNLISVEQYEATISAFMYPDEFLPFDGIATPVAGVRVGQQNRGSFGFSYRTLKGDDQNPDLGYLIHLIYGAQAAPSEKNYQTVNDTPAALEFSWDVTTTPVSAGTLNGVTYSPTATIIIDSTEVSAEDLANLESILYGSVDEAPRMPLPAEIYTLLAGTALTPAVPTQPTFASNTITIPTVTGVIYYIDGVQQDAGAVPITEDTLVTAAPAPGYTFAEYQQTQWEFEYTA